MGLLWKLTLVSGVKMKTSIYKLVSKGTMETYMSVSEDAIETYGGSWGCDGNITK